MTIVKRGEDPAFLNDFSKSLLDGFYLKDNESFDDALARTAEAFCYGDYELAQRIYDAAWNGWFMFASPLLSNAPRGHWNPFPVSEWTSNTNLSATYWVGDRPRSMPISCFAFTISDTIVGQMEAMTELAALSVAGGGIGIYSSIRATDEKAPGPIPYFKVIDSSIGYYRQGVSRRGACAVYMDVDHPDIIEHIKFRVPTGGDPARKADNRTQFHNAVNVTDEFVAAVIAGDDFDLRCPHTGEVKETVPARRIWEEILEARALTGEPYICKIDTVNRALPQAQKDRGLRVNSSNLCVTGDTKVLTSDGYFEIADIVGNETNVWNGKEWSTVIPTQTSDLSQIITIGFSNGQELRCTKYHKFYIHGENAVEKVVEASDLKLGDKLVKFDLPKTTGLQNTDYDPIEYWSGFYSGDGCSVRGKNRLYFYNEKLSLYDDFISEADQLGEYRSYDQTASQNRVYVDGTFWFVKYDVPTATATVGERLSFLAGFADADGTIARNGTNESLQLSNTNLDFLRDIQLMLQTLGVNSKITKCHEAGTRTMPDGCGGRKEYECQATFRLLISSYELWKLSELGFKTKRLKWDIRKPQRDASRFVTVVSLSDNGEEEPTYCFNEPLEHKGVFNGVLTGNCSEITLPTNVDRTFVCCLSSLNLETWDEWKDTTIVADLTRFLDNVLQWFIENAPKELKKAVFSAKMERAIGIGTMGWHYYLQKNKIPFESGGFNSAIQQTHIIFRTIKAQAEAESLNLGTLRGEAPDMEGTGRRNSHLLAIAPNSNNSIITGTSPSIEPVSGNAYTQSTRAGSFLVKNPYLQETLLEAADRLGIDNGAIDGWLEQQWVSIVKQSGSVQHLDFLTDAERELFKTAYEIDQHWIIEQGDARQQYVCQAQSLNLFFPAGVSREYYNSVHLKALTAPYLKTLYYSRMERSVDVDVVKQIERKALTDWADTDDCVACQG